MDDYFARLAADPEYQAKKRAFEDRRRCLEAFNSRAERPLVDALKKAGFYVKSVVDLVGRQQSYVRAIPILADHLQRNYPDEVRMGIAQALRVPEAKSAWPELVASFRMKKIPTPTVSSGCLG